MKNAVATLVALLTTTMTTLALADIPPPKGGGGGGCSMAMTGAQSGIIGFCLVLGVVTMMLARKKS